MVTSVGSAAFAGPSTQRGSPTDDAATADATARIASSATHADATRQPGAQVEISPAGAVAAARAKLETAGSDGGGTSADSQNASSALDPTSPVVAESADEREDPGEVSAVKSFAYGALGLERPDQPGDDQNASYSAGKWLAAGITIGGLISLLV